jgi:WD40 repeat protein
VEDLTWRGLYSPVRYLAFSPSGRLLAAQSYFEADVPVWNVADGTLVYSLEEHRGSSNGLAFSPDGLLIASPLNDPGGQSDSVGLWHALDGGYLRRLEGHTSWVFGIAFSPDSSSMASVGNDTTARIWRLADGSVIHSLDHPSSVDNVSYSPDGRLLATAAGDSTIRLWDPVEGRLVNSVFAGNLTTRSGLAFSPDGSLLAAGLVNGLVQIWAVRPPPS